MSLRSKFISTLSLSLGIAAFSFAAVAQDTTTPVTPDTKKAGKQFKRDRMAGRDFGGRHGKRDGMKHGGFRGIDLTDAQKAQIKTIREANKPDAATMTELRTIREARKAGTAITPEQQARVKAFREQSVGKRKAAHEQILAILTPEQRAQIETRKTEMRQRMEQRRTERKNRAPRTDKPVVK